jgi:hypothetical protein
MTVTRLYYFLLKITKAIRKAPARCQWLTPGGRDQEDRGSHPAKADSLGLPISKIPITKKDW